MRNNKPKLNVIKRRHILLYLIKKRGDLNHNGLIDLLYFMDFGWYERKEEPLTGTTYKKRIPKIQIILPKPMDFNLKYISKEEKEFIDEMLKKFSKMKSSDITSLSQKDIPYITAERNAPLSYESVFYRTDKFSVREKSSIS